MAIKNMYIVYAESDYASVTNLKIELQSRSIPYGEFLDSRHSPWQLVINDMKKYDAFLYIASPAAKASEPIAHVYEIAGDEHIPLIPFWVGGTTWSDVALPGLESTTDYIDARFDQKSAYARLFSMVMPTPSSVIDRVTKVLTLPFLIAGVVIGGLIGQWIGGSTQNSFANGVLLGAGGGMVCLMILSAIMQGFQDDKDGYMYYSFAFGTILLVLGAWLGARIGGWGGGIFGGISGYLLGFYLGILLLRKKDNRYNTEMLPAILINIVPFIAGAWIGAWLGEWGGGVIGGIVGFIVGARLASPFYRKRMVRGKS
jgi:hypothetical protein